MLDRLKKTRKLTRYVIFSLTITIAYMLWEIVMVTTHPEFVEPSTLTTCVFSLFGGEIVTCGLIKIFNIRKEDANG